MPDLTYVSASVAEWLKEPQGLWIDGRACGAARASSFEVFDPSSEQRLAVVADAQPEDVDRAVAAARTALEAGEWSQLRAPARARLMWRLADLIEEHADELALLEALDVGKPFTAARQGDILDTADRFRYFAGWVGKVSGQTMDHAGEHDRHAYTVREAVGVAALITAWNFPLFQAANKIGPALAAGCTVVIKPPELAPLSTIRLAQLAQKAGFPPGVINVLPGSGAVAGAALASHAGVDKVSFTGSTGTGRRILEAAGGNLKRVTLELGGKSPVILLEDADLKKAIPAVARSIFLNAGQVCSAGTRLYVAAAMEREVLSGIAAYAESLVAGDAASPSTTLGPLVSATQLDRVAAMCDRACAAGARVWTGSRRLSRRGHFFAPTVLSQVDPKQQAWTEEIFGPVLCANVLPEGGLEEIANAANEGPYGLAAYVWTSDAGRAHSLARALKAGLVVVNGGRRDASVPNGGFKQSGWGREHGLEAVASFTEVKSVVLGL